MMASIMNELQSLYPQGPVDGIAMPKRIELATFPMKVDREMGIELALPVAQVSTLRAKISERAGSLWMRDLGSTNGTWLIATRVKEA